MIKSYFGLRHQPFAIQDDAPLLEHQQRHFDILKVHSQQGGFCLILGEPGTGKTVLKNAIIRHDPKQWITPVINRSLHTTLQLHGQLDLKSRVTYSAKLELLSPASLADHIRRQLDLAGLPHATFTEEAIQLILRTSEGTLRAIKNLCTGALIEAVRDQTKTVDLKQVNAVLMQPHWRHNSRDEPAQPLVQTNQTNHKPRPK